MKKIKYLLLVFLLCFSLSGCGSTSESVDIKTELNIHTDYSGERMISGILVDNAFGSKTSKLDQVIEKTMPDVFKLTKTKEGNGQRYTFTLAFDSIEDYKTKVSKVIHREPVIKISQSDTVFAKGIMVSENFTSKELSNWFIDALVENGFVEKGSELINFDETKIFINGKEIFTNNEINVNDMEYWPLSYIEIETDLSKETITRTIRYVMKESVYESKSEEFDDYFKSITPEKSETSELLKDDNYGYVITFKGNEQEIIEKTKIALDTENESIEHIDVETDNQVKTYEKFEENLDLSAFTSNNDKSIRLKYKIKDKNYVLYEKDLTLNTQLEPSNTYYGEFNGPKIHVSVLKSNHLPLDKVEMNTKILNKSEIEKTITFILDKDISEDEINLLTKNKKYNKYFDIEEIRKDEYYKIIWKLKETDVKKANKILQKLFGKDNQISYQFKEVNDYTNHSSFKESIHMKEFFEVYDYKGKPVYTLTGYGNETLNDVKVNGKVTELKGKEIEVKIAQNVTITCDGKHFDIMYFVKIGGMILGGILVILGCISGYIYSLAKKYKYEIHTFGDILHFTKKYMKYKQKKISRKIKEKIWKTLN